MCEMCRQNTIHRFGPSRRNLLFGAASSMGVLLANAAGAKEMKAPPKPQNVLSPADVRSLAQLEHPGAVLAQGGVVFGTRQERRAVAGCRTAGERQHCHDGGECDCRHACQSRPHVVRMY